MLIHPVTVAALWRRAQAGWPRSFPIVQFPNAPLLVAFAGWGLAAVAHGTAHDVGRLAFVAGLGVWALMEVTPGSGRQALRARVAGPGGRRFESPRSPSRAASGVVIALATRSIGRGSCRKMAAGHVQR